MSSSVYIGAVRNGGVCADRVTGRTVISLSGEHDVSTAVASSEAIARAMSLDDADVVIELSSVTYISSATIHVILRAHEWLGQHGRSLTLRAPSPIACRILAVCEFDDLIEPNPDDNTRHPTANVAEHSSSRTRP